MFLPEDDHRKILTDEVATREKNALFKDVQWMVDAFANDDKTTPIWVGWNAIRDNKQVTKQKIWYLQQINESPTSYSVVFKTMLRSSEIAKACNRDSIAVKIQNEEKPVFDQLFLHLGAFHIKMALLKAFRKVIEESGGPYFSNECDVLAKGSMSSVCKGRTYKRAKHMYQLLALAMQILHFESFFG